MAKLALYYDTTTKKFVAATLDGRTLPGVSLVTLGPYTVSVIDPKGRDLLALAAQDEEAEPDGTQARQDIAQAFGFTDEPTPDGGPDPWDRGFRS